MGLVVETGSGVSTANAFVTRAELIAYAADYHPATTVPEDTTTDAAILRASSWLSSFIDWEGSPTHDRGGQGLAWPRTGAADCAGDSVPSDEIPAEVKTATYIAALAELTSPGLLAPTLTPGEQRKSVRVEGAVTEVYMTPQEQGVAGQNLDATTAMRPVLTAVKDALKCLGDFPDGIGTPWPWVA